MKTELVKILAKIPLATDPNLDAKLGMVLEAMSEFVERFP